MSAAPLAAVVALLLTVLCLWLWPRRWMVTVAATVALAYGAGVMHGPAVVWLVLLAASAWSLRSASGWRRALASGATAALGVLLGMHLMPGFVNVVVIRETVLAPGALPYAQYVNFDKTLGGVLLLAGGGFLPMRSVDDWRAAAARAAPWMLAAVLAVMLLSLAVSFVRLEPRWQPQFWVWAVVNLLTTCVSEEAFFCGLIQQESERALMPAAGPAVAGAAAIIISAALFGLAHLAGGWRYVLLAATAGSGYAVAYRTSRRLEMAIATHFLVNAIHFALFTYPALA